MGVARIVRARHMSMCLMSVTVSFVARLLTEVARIVPLVSTVTVTAGTSAFGAAQLQREVARTARTETTKSNKSEIWGYHIGETRAS
jgi:hypothetical protein